MTQETLERLNDNELGEVIARAQALLKTRDDERKAKAIADARAMRAKTESDARALLASVGLSFKAVSGKSGRHSHTYKGGHHYRHPAKPDLVWTAKGQKPNWLRELEREGGKAVEIAEPANDNAVPVKKTG
jgi:H-NS histone C-terminal domain